VAKKPAALIAFGSASKETAGMNAPSLALLASLVSTVTNFSGDWTGTGQMTQRSPILGNQVSACSLIEVKLEHLTDQLTIQRYHAVCGKLDSDWGPHPMEIRGTQVFEDGEETGTLEGDTLKTLQTDGGTQYAFNLRLKAPAASGVVSAEGQAPQLETYYGVRSGVGAIVIEGILQAK
jgi:hypothetical protein